MQFIFIRQPKQMVLEILLLTLPTLATFTILQGLVHQRTYRLLVHLQMTVTTSIGTERAA